MGGLVQAPGNNFVVDIVGKRALGILVIKENPQLVQSQFRIALDQSHSIKAIVPAPQIRHPIFGHQHGRSGQMPFRRHNAFPICISRQLRCLGEFSRNRGHLRQPLSILALQSLQGRVETLVLAGQPNALKLLDRTLKLSRFLGSGRKSTTTCSDLVPCQGASTVRFPLILVSMNRTRWVKLLTSH